MSVITLRTIGSDEDTARILVQRRTVFPGLGGEIITRYPVKCALRQERGVSEGKGLYLFLRHYLIKKLDDFNVITGRYHCPHVTAPYGVISREGTEGYIYQFADGQETFPWEMLTNRGNHEAVYLEEWSEFTQAFLAMGINLQRNVVMPDSRNAQNIIHADGRIEEVAGRPQLSAAWYRIDFDEESAGIDCQKLTHFLEQNLTELEGKLGYQRYRLLQLAVRVLSKTRIIDSTVNVNELAKLIGCYCLSALEHSKWVGGSSSGYGYG